MDCHRPPAAVLSARGRRSGCADINRRGCPKRVGRWPPRSGTAPAPCCDVQSPPLMPNEPGGGRAQTNPTRESQRTRRNERTQQRISAGRTDRRTGRAAIQTNPAAGTDARREWNSRPGIETNPVPQDQSEPSVGELSRVQPREIQTNPARGGSERCAWARRFGRGPRRSGRRRGARLGHALPGREALLAAGADPGEGRGELGQALEIVHRAEVVDVLDDRAGAGSAGRSLPSAGAGSARSGAGSSCAAAPSRAPAPRRRRDRGRR